MWNRSIAGTVITHGSARRSNQPHEYGVSLFGVTMSVLSGVNGSG